MSSLTDRSQPTTTVSGARALARLVARSGTHDDGAPANDAASAPAAPAETVTLGKIGDFLELDFGRLFTWLRQGLWFALALAVIGAVAGAAYAVFTPPRYTVSTDILIDPANLQVVNDDLFQQPGQTDAALLNAGSKLRVLTSGNVLLRVVDALALTRDKEFYDPDPSGFSLSALLPGGNSDKAEPDPRLAALASLSKKVSTRADETSFVATLFVSSEETDKAIRISDAMVEAFKAELANAEADGAGRTATALNNRLDELKAEVKAAEEAVETYKRENNLAAVSGELVSTQIMTQLNQQVVEAQSRVISLQTAYDELVAAGANASTADTQASTTIASLRATAGGLRQQLDAQSMVYGPRHPTIVKLNTELAAVNAQLDAEIGRIVGAARVSLDEANTNLAGLTAKANDMRSSIFTDNAAMVKLRELERDASSKAAIYESFLSRARQVTEREQLDTTNVRVISTAVPPPARSWPPRTVVVLGLGAIGGLVAGFGIAVIVGALRDLRHPPRRKASAAAVA